MPRINRPFAQRDRAETRRGSKPTDRAGVLAHDYRRAIGGWITDLRKDAELTQAQLGEALGGIYNTAVSAIETGRSGLPPERYEALADLLGVDHEEFAKTVLRYTDPWLYLMLFERTMKRAEREALRSELNAVPTRLRTPAAKTQ